MILGSLMQTFRLEVILGSLMLILMLQMITHAALEASCDSWITDNA